MPHKPGILFKYFIGNFIPAFQVGFAIYIVYLRPDWTGLYLLLTWIYLIPPILLRILHCLFGKPQGSLNESQSHYWLWYFGAQLQALYLRVPQLEELLRIFPLVYSNWLRLWGAKIGKATYWAPNCYILDRPYLFIGDFVVVGYGVGVTAHLINQKAGQRELVLAPPKIETNAILGGLSGLGPGAEVGVGEMLPATMQLAPFYRWSEGRRKSILSAEI